MVPDSAVPGDELYTQVSITSGGNTWHGLFKVNVVAPVRMAVSEGSSIVSIIFYVVLILAAVAILSFVFVL